MRDFEEWCEDLFGFQTRLDYYAKLLGLEKDEIKIKQLKALLETTYNYQMATFKKMLDNSVNSG